MMKSSVLLLLLVAVAAAADRATPPNIVVLLADDLGWSDLGCYGSTFHETPHLDRLAREGIRFTTYYTAGSVCSPTRASLMTGKYPVRTGITDWIPGMKPPANAALAPAPTRKALANDELTLGRAFQAAGYQTFYVGKWHLGPTAGGLGAYGFEHYAGEEGDEDGEETSAGRNQRETKLQQRRTATERFTRASLDFIAKRDRAKPFLLMLSYHDPHTPIQPMPGQVERFRTKAAALPAAPEPVAERNGLTRARQDNPDYASMVATLDASVAQIRTRLESLGLAGDTILVFASDNGGLATQKKPGPTSNAPLRSGKGWLYEGGIRAPLIVHLPGAPKPGVVCETPVISTDIFPTLLELAGLPARPTQHVDGRSFAAFLRDVSAPAASSRPLFWHYPHYHGSTWAPGAAVRDGDWKLIEFYDPAATELYNLAADPSETRDLAQANPVKTAELLATLRAWQKSAGAVPPTTPAATRVKLR
jgi:arylsulfatase A-like enzyme